MKIGVGSSIELQQQQKMSTQIISKTINRTEELEHLEIVSFRITKTTNRLQMHTFQAPLEVIKQVVEFYLKIVFSRIKSGSV